MKNIKDFIYKFIQVALVRINMFDCCIDKFQVDESISIEWDLSFDSIGIADRYSDSGQSEQRSAAIPTELSGRLLNISPN
jgi:hypothetical protein